MKTDSRPETDDLQPVSEAARGWNRLWGVLILALVARLIAIAVWPENLTDDRDGYLALSEGLAAGRGFSVHDTNTPTAYRPPLYPLALAPSAILPSGVWVALLHLTCGLLSVWLTWLLAVRLTANRDREPGALCIPALASLLVAVDPILLRYTTLPMTEVLATCLVIALLVVVTRRSGDSARQRIWRSGGTGVLFGLSVLCRPTVWAFGALVSLWAILRWVKRRIRAEPGGGGAADRDQYRLDGWIVVACAGFILLPWGVRNALVFGRPILMTTHGGYTLLLGNNPSFYREVVDQRWGTVWDGSHGGGQEAWAEKLNREMDAEGLAGEVERDEWMKRRAWSNIRSDPGSFVRACWLRLRRFWGLAPVEGAGGQSMWMHWGVGGFYLLVLGGAAAGLVSVCRSRFPAWGPSLLMIVAFMGVHLVYWTNTRMRAPIVPVIAVLAALGWCRLWRRWR